LLVLLALIPRIAAAQAAKIFTDKGSTWIRSDKKKALKVGAELDAVVEEKGKPVGKAIIMEVNGMLARVNVDEEATKAGAKFVLLAPAKGGPAAAAAPVEAKGGEAKPVEAAAPPKATLKGVLEHGLIGVRVVNETDQDWNNCLLSYSDGTSYKLGQLPKKSEDSVMKVKFGFPAAPLYDHVVVSCAEGESKFFFDKPNAPVGKIKGHAVNEGGGAVRIYNDGDASWANCDIRKPDGHHYVLGQLKGRDSDGIANARFRKEAEAKKDLFLTMVCDEGQLKIKAN
jgi:hypothetical protein